MTFKDYVKKAQNEPDIVKTVGDKGYDVKKTKVDPLTDMSYHDFLQHMPNKMGDVSKAVKYNSLSYNALDNSYIIDGYVNKNIYNDSIFDSSNKVMYNDDKKLEEMSEEEIKRMVEQYFDNGDRLPEKEEMDRRVRFGELIYV